MDEEKTIDTSITDDEYIRQGKEFIRQRITELRLKSGVSEYQMSHELGHHRSYIQAITSGKAMPSMEGFLAICEYFNMEPREFFDREYPRLVRSAEDLLVDMDDEDVLLLLNLIKRYFKK